MRISRKQTGTPNTKGVAKRGKARKIIPPWGSPVPKRTRKTASSVSGSAVKQAHSDASLAPQTKGYPHNQPWAWPVEPDLVNHTLPPPLSGYTDEVAAANNAAVNHAYERAGY